MRLAGTTIVVTGASSGLGKAMSAAFVEAGAAVACAARTESRLVDAVGEMAGPGEAIAVPTDVRSPDDVTDLVEETADRLGPIDVLVNNAGIMQQHVDESGAQRPVPEVGVQAWDAVLETNLRGPFLCSRAALPGMLERDAGRLIHLSSGHGVSGRANRAPYVASKFGLEGFHESLALELEGTGVSSVALRPPGGGIFTETRAELGHDPDSYGHRRPEVIADGAVRLAGGEGENGGRYLVSEDGRELRAYERA